MNNYDNRVLFQQIAIRKWAFEQDPVFIIQLRATNEQPEPKPEPVPAAGYLAERVA